MSATARRIAVAASGLALTLATVASGPAAFAGKPAGGGGTKPSTSTPMSISSYVTATDLFINYALPVGSRDRISTVCTVDGTPVGCGDDFWAATSLGTPLTFQLVAQRNRWSTAVHTYAITEHTRKGDFTGSVQFTGTAA